MKGKQEPRKGEIFKEKTGKKSCKKKRKLARDIRYTAGAPNSSRLSLEGVLISWARAARACVVLSSHCPLSMALAMSLLAASVKWIPSHEMDLDGSAHAVDPRRATERRELEVVRAAAATAARGQRRVAETCDRRPTSMCLKRVIDLLLTCRCAKK